MKADWSHLDPFRKNDASIWSSASGDRHGVFYLTRGTTRFVAIASDGSADIPWEHVSARAIEHRGERVPRWDEMCWLKSLFWDDEECVVQYHPPKSDYVNNHPFVLHLWKPTNIELPRPPSIAVGIK